VNPDNIHAKGSRKVADGLQLRRAFRAQILRRETDRFYNGGNVGVTFAFETCEDDADLDAQFVESLFKLSGPLRCSRRGVWRVQMYRVHT
jgi:hypothetical protein